VQRVSWSERLVHARLYLVTPAIAPEALRAAIAGGVDVVQLRMKDADDEAILREAAVVRAVCAQSGVPFVLNDRPDLVAAAGADGVHVGQDDVPVAHAREVVGPDRIVGLSTHSPAQADAAATLGVDYFAAGPVHATPTKPGRPAAGIELVRHVATTTRGEIPWFAIGGIDRATIGDVIAAGARRVVVVRAITEAEDPGAATREFVRRLAG
jgi:thiamine-phosphate pyrophosphorylase